MWYAIRTKPGHEKNVKQKIENMMIKGNHDDCRILYCVKKKRYLGAWHDEKSEFLPGYVFLVTHETEAGGRNIERLPVFPEVLLKITESSGSGNKICLVKREEEEFLARLTNGKDEIGMSYGIIQKGVLKIREGVLVGMESRVRKIDRHKRKGYIAIKINSEEIAEIGLEITEKT